jgi:hypothetical protein
MISGISTKLMMIKREPRQLKPYYLYPLQHEASFLFRINFPAPLRSPAGMLKCHTLPSTWMLQIDVIVSAVYNEQLVVIQLLHREEFISSRFQDFISRRKAPQEKSEFKLVC